MLRDLYQAERKQGWRAAAALRNARTRQRFADLNGYIDYCEEYPPLNHHRDINVRLCIMLDSQPYDVSYVDTWTDVPEAKRERIKAETLDRVSNEGLFGVVGQYWDGNEWIDADSCWGFIGTDWVGSGYDTDIMQATVSAYIDSVAPKALYI